MQKESVERELGYKITFRTYQKALKSAKCKRELLVRRFGTADGKRLMEGYLILLTAEAVRMDQLQEETMRICREYYDMEKEHSGNQKCPSPTPIL